MQYDPVKRILGKVFNRHPVFRIFFYKLLDLLLLRSWHIRKALRNWKKNRGDEASILDAGSGFGQYSYYLSNLSENYTVTGIEIKEEQVEDCNHFFTAIGKKNRVVFKVADLTVFTSEPAYDLILSVDVMEHIEEDVQVFKNFYQMLKSGGMLLISTPSDQGGSDVHEEGDASFIEEHVRNGYGMDEIIKKLNLAGFTNVSAFYSYGKPGKISWLLSMKFPLSILNLTKLFFILLPFYYLLVFPFCLILNLFDLYIVHKTGTGLIVKAVK